MKDLKARTIANSMEYSICDANYSLFLSAIFRPLVCLNPFNGFVQRICLT